MLNPIRSSLGKLETAYGDKAENVLEKRMELRNNTLGSFIKAVKLTTTSSLDADTVFKDALDDLFLNVDILGFQLRNEITPSQSGAGARTAAQSTTDVSNG
ncbi:uncharacterized protein L203_104147 [Cryptococcus depauperatus CBS 7841]|uniref:Uncharacterized protein n=1 Tax=Cryptococcus depauperatus CBS 7841 TaxID=1295531 RepID=A0A1E3IBC3_9TREE|nr:hypothetical protein L203_04403 [Cryptococcus depauperatus CBS 7841]